MHWHHLLFISAVLLYCTKGVKARYLSGVPEKNSGNEVDDADATSDDTKRRKRRDLEVTTFQEVEEEVELGEIKDNVDELMDEDESERELDMLAAEADGYAHTKDEDFDAIDKEDLATINDILTGMGLNAPPSSTTHPSKSSNHQQMNTKIKMVINKKNTPVKKRRTATQDNARQQSFGDSHRRLRRETPGAKQEPQTPPPVVNDYYDAEVDYELDDDDDLDISLVNEELEDDMLLAGDIAVQRKKRQRRDTAEPQRPTDVVSSSRSLRLSRGVPSQNEASNQDEKDRPNRSIQDTHARISPGSDVQTRIFTAEAIPLRLARASDETDTDDDDDEGDEDYDDDETVNWKIPDVLRKREVKISSQSLRTTELPVTHDDKSQSSQRIRRQSETKLNRDRSLGKKWADKTAENDEQFLFQQTGSYHEQRNIQYNKNYHEDKNELLLRQKREEVSIKPPKTFSARKFDNDAKRRKLASKRKKVLKKFDSEDSKDSEADVVELAEVLTDIILEDSKAGVQLGDRLTFIDKSDFPAERDTSKDDDYIDYEKALIPDNPEPLAGAISVIIPAQEILLKQQLNKNIASEIMNASKTIKKKKKSRKSRATVKNNQASNIRKGIAASENTEDEPEDIKLVPVHSIMHDLSTVPFENDKIKPNHVTLNKKIETIFQQVKSQEVLSGHAANHAKFDQYTERGVQHETDGYNLTEYPTKDGNYYLIDKKTVNVKGRDEGSFHSQQNDGNDVGQTVLQTTSLKIPTTGQNHGVIFQFKTGEETKDLLKYSNAQHGIGFVMNTEGRLYEPNPKNGIHKITDNRREENNCTDNKKVETHVDKKKTYKVFKINGKGNEDITVTENLKSRSQIKITDNPIKNDISKTVDAVLRDIHPDTMRKRRAAFHDSPQISKLIIKEKDDKGGKLTVNEDDDTGRLNIDEEDGEGHRVKIDEDKFAGYVRVDDTTRGGKLKVQDSQSNRAFNHDKTKLDRIRIDEHGSSKSVSIDEVSGKDRISIKETVASEQDADSKYSPPFKYNKESIETFGPEKSAKHKDFLGKTNHIPLDNKGMSDHIRIDEKGSHIDLKNANGMNKITIDENLRNNKNHIKIDETIGHGKQTKLKESPDNVQIKAGKDATIKILEYLDKFEGKQKKNKNGRKKHKEVIELIQLNPKGKSLKGKHNQKSPVSYKGTVWRKVGNTWKKDDDVKLKIKRYKQSKRSVNDIRQTKSLHEGNEPILTRYQEGNKNGFYFDNNDDGKSKSENAEVDSHINGHKTHISVEGEFFQGINNNINNNAYDGNTKTRYKRASKSHIPVKSFGDGKVTVSEKHLSEGADEEDIELKMPKEGQETMILRIPHDENMAVIDVKESDLDDDDAASDGNEDGRDDDDDDDDDDTDDDDKKRKRRETDLLENDSYEDFLNSRNRRSKIPVTASGDGKVNIVEKTLFEGGSEEDIFLEMSESGEETIRLLIPNEEKKTVVNLKEKIKHKSKIKDTGDNEDETDDDSSEDEMSENEKAEEEESEGDSSEDDNSNERKRRFANKTEDQHNDQQPDEISIPDIASEEGTVKVVGRHLFVGGRETDMLLQMPEVRHEELTVADFRKTDCDDRDMAGSDCREKRSADAQFLSRSNRASSLHIPVKASGDGTIKINEKHLFEGGDEEDIVLHMPETGHEKIQINAPPGEKLAVIHLDEFNDASVTGDVNDSANTGVDGARANHIPVKASGDGKIKVTEKHLFEGADEEDIILQMPKNGQEIINIVAPPGEKLAIVNLKENIGSDSIKKHSDISQNNNGDSTDDRQKDDSINDDDSPNDDSANDDNPNDNSPDNDSRNNDSPSDEGPGPTISHIPVKASGDGKIKVKEKHLFEGGDEEDILLKMPKFGKETININAPPEEKLTIVDVDEEIGSLDDDSDEDDSDDDSSNERKRRSAFGTRGEGPGPTISHIPVKATGDGKIKVKEKHLFEGGDEEDILLKMPKFGEETISINAPPEEKLTVVDLDEEIGSLDDEDSDEDDSDEDDSDDDSSNERKRRSAFSTGGKGFTDLRFSRNQTQIVYHVPIHATKEVKVIVTNNQLVGEDDKKGILQVPKEAKQYNINALPEEKLIVVDFDNITASESKSDDKEGIREGYKSDYIKTKSATINEQQQETTNDYKIESSKVNGKHQNVTPIKEKCRDIIDNILMNKTEIRPTVDIEQDDKQKSKTPGNSQGSITSSFPPDKREAAASSKTENMGGRWQLDKQQLVNLHYQQMFTDNVSKNVNISEPQGQNESIKITSDDKKQIPFKDSKLSFNYFDQSFGDAKNADINFIRLKREQTATKNKDDDNDEDNTDYSDDIKTQMKNDFKEVNNLEVQLNEIILRKRRNTKNYDNNVDDDDDPNEESNVGVEIEIDVDRTPPSEESVYTDDNSDTDKIPSKYEDEEKITQNSNAVEIRVAESLNERRKIMEKPTDSDYSAPGQETPPQEIQNQNEDVQETDISVDTLNEQTKIMEKSTGNDVASAGQETTIDIRETETTQQQKPGQQLPKRLRQKKRKHGRQPPKKLRSQQRPKHKKRKLQPLTKKRHQSRRKGRPREKNQKDKLFLMTPNTLRKKAKQRMQLSENKVVPVIFASYPQQRITADQPLQNNNAAADSRFMGSGAGKYNIGDIIMQQAMKNDTGLSYGLSEQNIIISVDNMNGLGEQLAKNQIQEEKTLTQNEDIQVNSFPNNISDEKINVYQQINVPVQIDNIEIEHEQTVINVEQNQTEKVLEALQSNRSGAFASIKTIYNTAPNAQETNPEKKTIAEDTSPKNKRTKKKEKKRKGKQPKNTAENVQAANFLQEQTKVSIMTDKTNVQPEQETVPATIPKKQAIKSRQGPKKASKKKQKKKIGKSNLAENGTVKTEEEKINIQLTETNSDLGSQILKLTEEISATQESSESKQPTKDKSKERVDTQEAAAPLSRVSKSRKKKKSKKKPFKKKKKEKAENQLNVAISQQQSNLPVEQVNETAIQQSAPLATYNNDTNLSVETIVNDGTPEQNNKKAFLSVEPKKKRGKNKAQRKKNKVPRKGKMDSAVQSRQALPKRGNKKKTGKKQRKKIHREQLDIVETINQTLSGNSQSGYTTFAESIAVNEERETVRSKKQKNKLSKKLHKPLGKKRKSKDNKSVNKKSNKVKKQSPAKKSKKWTGKKGGRAKARKPLIAQKTDVESSQQETDVVVMAGTSMTSNLQQFQNDTLNQYSDTDANVNYNSQVKEQVVVDIGMPLNQMTQAPSDNGLTPQTDRETQSDSQLKEEVVVNISMPLSREIASIQPVPGGVAESRGDDVVQPPKSSRKLSPAKMKKTRTGKKKSRKSQAASDKEPTLNADQKTLSGQVSMSINSDVSNRKKGRPRKKQPAGNKPKGKKKTKSEKTLAPTAGVENNLIAQITFSDGGSIEVNEEITNVDKSDQGKKRGGKAKQDVTEKIKIKLPSKRINKKIVNT